MMVPCVVSPTSYLQVWRYIGADYTDPTLIARFAEHSGEAMCLGEEEPPDFGKRRTQDEPLTM